MKTKDIILELRTKKGLSQEELAEKMFVTRQAVSRWENGDTVPNVETLKLLSKFFDVSINTLLGTPHKLVCKCCGMELEDSEISKETNGNFNEEYCKWCYQDGDYTLDFWKKNIKNGKVEKFEEYKRKLISEINTLLKIDGYPKVEKLNVLPGSFVNLEYKLENGDNGKFLDDDASYLGSQLEIEGAERCIGIASNMDFIVISSYEKDGENPKLITYKKRKLYD